MLAITSKLIGKYPVTEKPMGTILKIFFIFLRLLLEVFFSILVVKRILCSRRVLVRTNYFF